MKKPASSRQRRAILADPSAQHRVESNTKRLKLCILPKSHKQPRFGPSSSLIVVP